MITRTEAKPKTLDRQTATFLIIFKSNVFEKFFHTILIFFYQRVFPSFFECYGTNTKKKMNLDFLFFFKFSFYSFIFEESVKSQVKGN